MGLWCFNNNLAISSWSVLLLLVEETWLYGRNHSGADPGGAHPAHATPKIGKKHYFFPWNRDFSHEIPQIFSRLPPQLEKIWFFCIKSWFFTRNTPKMFAPPSARHNLFKCTPLTWNPGSAPAIDMSQITDKLSHIYVVSSTLRHDHDSNSQI